MSWNFGDILDGIERVLPPQAPALVQGGRQIDWGAFGRASNNLARELLAGGARPGDRVAFYLRNRPEYLIALAACFKARLVHVNVNYRYVDEELAYILDNSDAQCAIFGEEFAERAWRLAKRSSGPARWLQAGGAAAPFAEPLAELCAEGSGEPLAVERSPDDLVFVYTGGTTGLPKAVMWRHEDLWGALSGGATIPANRDAAPASLAIHVGNVARHGPGPRQIPACPLMHGTGLFTAIVNLMAGGCAVLLRGERFDPVELFDTVERHAVESLVIVGDAFARPMLRTLDENPGRWELRSLRAIISSGVMWSRPVKEGLLRHQPKMRLADVFGSSEAVGFGTSVTSREGETETAVFQIGESCKVFTEDQREVRPGSGERGFIARAGPIPLGYFKDPEKSARTFPVVDGVRYAVPGDWCTVEADGTIVLLGRGSACINSAGEKIHAEEVEEALKTHADVDDALVVGVPDERFGQAVTAVVRPRGGDAPDEQALREHVRARLAGYKVPKRVLLSERAFRAPNGKADYAGALAFAERALGLAEARA